VNLWGTQNLAYNAILAAQQKWRSEEQKENPEAKTWLEHLTVLQDKLKLHMA